MAKHGLCVGLVIFATLLAIHVTVTRATSENSDIILDESRPEVFYCQTGNSAQKDKKVLAALPLNKLCQYGVSGKRPVGAVSDCLNDSDETLTACDEKTRFLKRMKVRQDALNLVNGL